MLNRYRPSLGVIGAGRVGSALTRALHRAGYPVVAVWSRNPAHAQELAATVAATVEDAPHAVAAAAELTLLAVPDDAIAPLASAIAEQEAWRPGRAVVHLSGTHGAAILASATHSGTLIGALHPLQSFATRDAPVLPGTTYAIEATEPLHTALRFIVEALDGRPLSLDPGDRSLYHAAAVMAANYTVTLVSNAVALLQRCGLDADQALAALLPLLRGTIDNLSRAGLPDALTGPIARGDTGTVAQHLEAMDLHAPEVTSLYRALGAATLSLAAARGLSQERLEQFEELLNSMMPVEPQVSR